MALGTEGVGFWFQGPNNYVTQQRRGQLPEPDDGSAPMASSIQMRHLGNISVPNFKGADTFSGGPVYTTKNGNNLPLLQFENNEAYGAMQGGLTFWWVSSQDPQPSANAQESLHPGSEALEHLQQGRLHVSQPEGDLRRHEDPRQLHLGEPVLRQRRLLGGLFVEGDHHSRLGYSGHGGGHHGARGRLRPGTEPHHREFLSAQLPTTSTSPPTARSTAAGWRTSWSWSTTPASRRRRARQPTTSKWSAMSPVRRSA